MMDLSRKFLLLLIAGLFTFGVAGCNTMEGAGQDTQEAGETIERGADDAEDEM